MGTRTNDGNGVKTTQTAFELLEHLQDNDGGQVSDIAKEMGLAKSTVHRHLSTLYEMGYVIKEGDIYHVGLRFLNLGEYARTRRDEYIMAKPKVEELAEETEERAQFIVEEHGYGIYVYRARGRHAVKTDPGIGKRIPLHAVAAGKAILAHLPEEKVSRIIEQRGLPSLTSNTITDREMLLNELETIRKRGYSFNNQENLEGLKAVGVPIQGANGEIIGSLSVSGPTHRMKGDRFESKLPDRLLGIANELELNIAHA